MRITHLLLVYQNSAGEINLVCPEGKVAAHLFLLRAAYPILQIPDPFDCVIVFRENSQVTEISDRRREPSENPWARSRSEHRRHLIGAAVRRGEKD